MKDSNAAHLLEVRRDIPILSHEVDIIELHIDQLLNLAGGRIQRTSSCMLG